MPLRYRKDDRAPSGSTKPLRTYGHLKLSKMAACRQLGFDVTGNSAIRSADPDNPTLEPNMKCIGLGSPVAEIWPFACLWGIWNPYVGGRGGRRGSAMALFERAMVVLHCDRCAICNHSAAICDRMPPTLKSTRGGSFWAQISGCSPWSRPLMFGFAESEHPSLTNGIIISEEFQHM